MSTVNHYFNNYNNQIEQRLVEDLIVESIKIMGFTAYYIPISNPEERDILFGEDPLKKFKSAFPIEMYLSSALQYDGDRDYFSKFGLEIRNEASVVVSRRSYKQRVPSQAIADRPREGDLVYIPVVNGIGNLFEITFTDHTKDFFLLGRKAPYFYELKLQQFRFSQEYINTGVDEIDSVVQDAAYTVKLNLSNGSGAYQLREIIYQSPDGTYANNTTYASVQGWDRDTKILSVTYIKGEFIDGQSIIGQTSGASWTLINYNMLDIVVQNDSYDNNFIHAEGDSITDFTENNPFGTI